MLPGVHEDLSLTPSIHVKTLGMVAPAFSPSLRGRDQQVARAHWSVSRGYVVSSRCVTDPVSENKVEPEVP